MPCIKLGSATKLYTGIQQTSWIPNKITIVPVLIAVINYTNDDGLLLYNAKSFDANQSFDT